MEVKQEIGERNKTDREVCKWRGKKEAEKVKKRREMIRKRGGKKKRTKVEKKGGKEEWGRANKREENRE